MPATNVIKWVGTKRHYKSADGRFLVMKSDRPQQWVLFDYTRVDACTPEYTWTTYATTLASAKIKAARALRDFPGVVR